MSVYVVLNASKGAISCTCNSADCAFLSNSPNPIQNCRSILRFSLPKFETSPEQTIMSAPEYSESTSNSPHRYLPRLPANPCPSECEVTRATAAGTCPICVIDYEEHDPVITHKSCHQSFCYGDNSCLLTWIDFTQTNVSASCPLCREPLGHLRDSRNKIWLVDSLDALRNIVGNDTFMTEPLAEHSHGLVNSEYIIQDNAHEASAGDCPYLRHHVHNGEWCPVNLRNVLFEADQTGQLIALGDTTAVNAVAEFDMLASLHGEPHAIQLALSNPFVSNKLSLRRQQKAREDASRLLYRLNSSSGVRFYEAYKFVEFDPSITFYLPSYPSLRALGSITELRQVVSAGVATTEYSQTGEWLLNPEVYTTDELHSRFNIDASDGYTGYLLDNLSSHSDLEGWAVFRTDDMSFDMLFAIPRFFFSNVDLPLREPQSYFVDEEGQPEVLHARGTDFSQIPARMMDLWEYNHIFNQEIDSP